MNNICPSQVTSRSARLRFESLESRRLLAGNPIISEFMAKNDGFLEDGDGNAPDWIEIQNVGESTLDLAGYRLTDRPRNLARWVFPSVSLEPGKYLIVFASGQDVDNYVDGGGNLHTNFSLSAGGEYLALVSPDGTIVSQFGDARTDYPQQIANISYGLAQRDNLVNAQSDVAYWVPTHGDVDTSWQQPDFDAAGHGFLQGKAALGYEGGRTTSRTSFHNEIITTLPEEPLSVYARIQFDVTNTAHVTGLNLRMKYDDGFIAYLNGEKVVESNAPILAQWSSGALNRRSDRKAFSFEDFDLSESLSQLKDGTNVIAIHGLSHESDRTGMLIAPQLMTTLNDPDAKIGYMTLPTPGTSNEAEESVFSGIVAETSISVDAGFYDAPLNVSIHSTTPNAQIRYTTDGSRPTLTNGITYTEAIPIDTTTTLRASSFLEDHIPSSVATRSYLFLQDVIRQSNDQPGLPTRWQQSSHNFAADYEMDQEIVNDPSYRDDIIDGLRSIRTMSITMDPDDFLGPEGIYIQTGQHGVESERPISMEIIEPDGSLAVQVDAGLRNHGNRTRDFDVTLKQSFRLVFSPRNGPRKLDYALYPESTADRFDNITLHAGKLLDDPQLVRNSFGRDSNRAMGNVDAHSTYVHLYFNGLYWGLYNAFERIDAEFAQTYFGGSDTDYDAVLNNSERIDGDTRIYNAVWRELRAGLESQEDFEAFQRMIDLDSLFDLLLINQYMAHDEHELRAIGNREGDPNFRFFIQDVDEGGMNRVRSRTNIAEFLPGQSYDLLRQNPETRMRYADRAHKHLFNDGALTPEATADRWQSRYAEIFTAVIGETARWGDTHWRSRFPREAVRRDVELAREGTFLDETYFPQRTQIVIDQLRRSNIYPDLDAPTFDPFGGEVLPDFELNITNPNETGTIYYSLDGTDPRVFGGGVEPSSVEHDGLPVAIGQGAIVKARVFADGEWSALTEAQFIGISADINDDGQVDAGDIDSLCTSIRRQNLQSDLNSDGVIDQHDLFHFVQNFMQTEIGDSNLDGQFEIDDLRLEEYEDKIAENSTWSEGDWNCDLESNSADIVLAFTTNPFAFGRMPLPAIRIGDLPANLADNLFGAETIFAKSHFDVNPEGRHLSWPQTPDKLKIDLKLASSPEQRNNPFHRSLQQSAVFDPGLMRDALIANKNQMEDGARSAP